VVVLDLRGQVVWEQALVVEAGKPGDLVILRVIRANPSGIYLIGVFVSFHEYLPRVHLPVDLEYYFYFFQVSSRNILNFEVVSFQLVREGVSFFKQFS